MNNGRVHIGAPGASNRTKVTSYVKLPFPVARTRTCTRALSFLASKGWWATSPAFGSGSVRPKFFLYGHTKQARAGHREKPRRRRHTTIFPSQIELAHLRKPRVRIRPRPLDLRPPVSRLVQPPRLSLRVPSCVVCRGQSHGRGGSRIAIFITARGSGATRARHLARRCHQSWRCHFRLRDACQRLFVARLLI